MIKINITGLQELQKEVKETTENIRKEFAQKLSIIGEKYVQTARQKQIKISGLKVHKDWTTNLRNAHSYAVFLDGKQMYSNFGNNEAQSFLESKRQLSKGLELIVGDPMEYASFVEGKGFNVTQSGILQVEQELRKLLQN